LSQQLGHNYENDGTFFMEFSEFMKYFHDYQICHCIEANIYSAQRYNSSSEVPVVFSFEIPKHGDYFFTVTQTSRKQFKKEEGKPQFNPSLRLQPDLNGHRQAHRARHLRLHRHDPQKGPRSLDQSHLFPRHLPPLRKAISQA
jgi:hypothetical protein